MKTAEVVVQKIAPIVQVLWIFAGLVVKGGGGRQFVSSRPAAFFFVDDQAQTGSYFHTETFRHCYLRDLSCSCWLSLFHTRRVTCGSGCASHFVLVLVCGQQLLNA